MNTFLKSVVSGLAGAAALNLWHETIRRVVPEAPRADILGERSLQKIMRAVGKTPSADEEDLYGPTMVADLLSNTAYYSLIGTARPEHAYPVGAALGLAAGVGALVLPGPWGLGKAPTNRTTATQVMTVGWYLLGGLVTAAVYTRLAERPVASSDETGEPTDAPTETPDS